MLKRSLRYVFVLLCVGVTLMARASAVVPVAPVDGESAASVQASRPRVAVVLAGGGARGVAHIKVLQAIEAAGLPVDLVVGNSMGSIIGGLYAAGYSPAQMERIVHNVDWMQLLLDNPDYGNPLLTARKANENYLLRVTLNYARSQSVTGKGGVISGRNIERLLRSLTRGLPDSISFAHLPIPFACVATDAITGRLVELHSGNLVQAMRSSMSIPGVFTPIQWADTLLLVDGFIKNNFPVDVARSMGVDVVIGVDITSRGDEDLVAKYSNMMELATHLFDFYSDSLYQQNIAHSHVYIPIDATGYSSASFTPDAIDTLLDRGAAAARLAVPQLDSLRIRLGLPAPPPGHRQASRGDHSPHDVAPLSPYHIDYNDQAEVEPDTIASLNIGARFDNEEYASVIMNVNGVLPFRRHVAVQLFARLGQRLGAGIGLSHTFAGLGTLRMGYRLQHRTLNYYSFGQRVSDATSNHHRIFVAMSEAGRKFMYSFGMRYDIHHYTDFLVRKDVAEIAPDVDMEHYFTYYGHGEYNSFDSQLFPSRGSQLYFGAEMITSNLYEFHRYAPIPILTGYWQTAIPTAPRLTLLPSVQARIIISGDAETPMPLRNVVGGFGRGMAVAHQMTMAGVPYMEFVAEDAVVTLGTKMQYHVCGNHYVVGELAGASFTYHVDDLLASDNIFWGATLGYGYRSVGGPVYLRFHYSDRTDHFRCTVSAGWEF